jgi:hypothetical protein
MRGDVPERVTAAEAEHELELIAKTIRARPVSLVHRKDVGDLHHAGLQRLDRIA